MKSLFKTFVLIALAVVLVGCNTTDASSEKSQIYDSLTKQKAEEVETDPKTFTNEQLEYYKTILSPFDMAFGIASVPGLDFKSPEQIPADRLVNFYYVNGFEGYLNEHSTTEERISVPAEEVESFVQNYFDVTEKYLRTSERFPYNEQTNTYLFKTEMGFGGLQGYEILNVLEEDGLLIFFCSGGVSDEFATKGCNVVVVDLKNDGFRYVCAKSFMEYL